MNLRKTSAYVGATCIACTVIVAVMPARVAWAHGEVSVQIRDLTKQIKREPGNAELYHKRGRLYHARGGFDLARNDYCRAEALDPALDGLAFSQARTAFASGRFGRALADLSRFLSSEPDHLGARWHRGRTLVELRRRDEAEVEFRYAFQRTEHPSPEQTLTRVGNLEALGRSRDALRVVDEALVCGGSVMTLQLAAVELELKLDESEAALSRLDHLISAAARQEVLLYRKGEILERLGMAADAARAYEEASLALERLPPRLRSTKRMRELDAQLSQKC